MDAVPFVLTRRPSLGWPDKRSPFRVESNASATAFEETIDGFTNPEKRKDGKGERRPMHEGRWTLMAINAKERPRNSDASSKITFLRREGICRGSRLEEE